MVYYKSHKLLWRIVRERTHYQIYVYVYKTTQVTLQICLNQTYIRVMYPSNSYVVHHCTAND